MKIERPEELNEPSWLDRLAEWMVVGFAIGALAFAVIHERLL